MNGVSINFLPKSTLCRRGEQQREMEIQKAQIQSTMHGVMVYEHEHDVTIYVDDVHSRFVKPCDIPNIMPSLRGISP